MHLPHPAIASGTRLHGLPERLFMAASHREVAAALDRGLARPRAVIAVSGEAGLGKTTLVDAVITGLGGSAGPVRQTRGAAGDVLSTLNALIRRSDDAASAPGPATAAGVLIIDDAQELGPTVLDRLGAVLERDAANEIRPHIVFVARPEFWNALSGPKLARLRDRIDVRAVLFPMVYAESEAYVEHLFRLAGSSARAVLSEAALHALVLRAQGNLRRLNAELERTLASGSTRQLSGPVAELPPGSIPIAAPTTGWGRSAAIGAGVVAIALAGAAVLLPEPWLSMVLPTESSDRNVAERPFVASRSQPAPEPAPAAAPPAAPPVVAATPLAPPPAATPIAPPVVAEPAPVPPAAEPAPPLRVEQAATAVPAPGATAAPAEPAASPLVASLTEPAPPAIAVAPPAPTSPPAAPQPAVPAAPLPAPIAVLPPAAASPAAAPRAVPTPSTPLAEALPEAVITTLLRRGDEMLELKDLSAARRLYQRAAMAGSARAALALGATYDPKLRTGAMWDSEASVATATAWYELAESLGDSEARGRLARLAAEGPAR